MCTADAKLCPDGSYVSRIAPTCEFTPCPTPTSSVPADWKTYTNTKYGFEVKYPTKWSITLNTDNRTVIQFIGTNPPATSEVVTFEMRPLGQTIGDASGQWQSYTLGGRDAHLGPAPDESGDSRVAIVVNLGQSKELAIIFPGRPGPSIYDQILSTFKFTK